MVLRRRGSVIADRELFDRLTREWGGRFPWELAPERTRVVYEEVAGRANDLVDAVRRDLRRLPPIHFDFILNSSINAVAFEANGRYFVAIHTGMLYMLRFVIGRMLSDKGSFLRIGDVQAETKLGRIVNYIPDAEEMRQTSALLTPQDAIRGSFAWFLQDQAIMFFVGHEIAHITRGHVAYLNRKHGMVTRELGLSTERSRQELIERQCIEFDADRRSIVSRIDSLRITMQNPLHPELPWAKGGNANVQIIQDWAVSLATLFRLFGDQRFTHAQMSASSYPPLLLRRMMCEALVINVVAGLWDPSLQSRTIEALLAAERETGEAFANMVGPEKFPVEFAKNGGMDLRQHAELLQDLWDRRMADEVGQYSYE